MGDSRRESAQSICGRGCACHRVPPLALWAHRDLQLRQRLTGVQIIEVLDGNRCRLSVYDLLLDLGDKRREGRLALPCLQGEVSVCHSSSSSILRTLTCSLLCGRHAGSCPSLPSGPRGVPTPIQRGAEVGRVRFPVRKLPRPKSPTAPSHPHTSRGSAEPSTPTGARGARAC